jgi:two-component system, LytTR family, sensor kinase
VNRPAWFPSRIVVIALLLLYTAIGLLLFGYRYFEDLATQRTGTLLPRFIDEMTGVYTALAAIPIIFWTARRFPITRQTWKTAIPIAFAGACAYSALHTTLMWITRIAIYPAAGQGSYDYGNMIFRYPMEASNDLISFATITGFIYFMDRMAAARQAELAAADLQTKLAEAQLENLRLQLNPHFLFNTLNAISSVMYEDLAKADEMLTKLSDFLRIVLASNGVHQVALDEELAVERKYVEIMTARLEQRLDLRVNVEAGAASAIVPFMILQPLLENSIRHGTPGNRGALDIGIDVARRNGSTVICVTDDGIGFNPENGTRGHGLALVNSRLDHMYGGAATFTIARRDGGGTEAILTFPYTASPQALS